MLSRVKFDISILVDEILDHLPDDVWQSPTTKFVDPAIGGGQFVAEIEKRLREYGHDDDNIKDRVFGFETNTMRLQYAVNKNNLVGNYQVGDFLKWKTIMKFDVVIGNPPYQIRKSKRVGSNSSSIYPAFVKKAHELCNDGVVSLVIPSDWCGGVSQANFLKYMKTKPITYIEFIDGVKVFGVQKLICYFVSDVSKDGETVDTTIIDSEQQELIMDISQQDTIPILSSGNYSILERFKTQSNVGHRYIHGELYLNQIEAGGDGQQIMITAVGRKNSPYNTAIVDSQTEGLAGRGLHKLVIQHSTSPGNVGAVKISKVDEGIGFSVMALTANDEDELNNLFEYLHSNVVRFIIRKIKISKTNSLTVFSYIPEIDFTRSWTDEELYEHFGLTEDEIKDIEDTVK